MGFFSFALQGNYKRFYGDLKELSKKTHKPAWFMFLDTAVCALRYGSGLQDYLNFQFYNKTHAERKTYVSVSYLDKVITKLSNIKWSPYISNKTNFHKNYGPYTRRDFFDPDGGYEALRHFWKEIRSLFTSPRSASAARVFPRSSQQRSGTEKHFLSRRWLPKPVWRNW